VRFVLMRAVSAQSVGSEFGVGRSRGGGRRLQQIRFVLLLQQFEGLHVSDALERRGVSRH
jgi:hypothetical protein